jgi:hypothetical protein
MGGLMSFFGVLEGVATDAITTGPADDAAPEISSAAFDSDGGWTQQSDLALAIHKATELIDRASNPTLEEGMQDGWVGERNEQQQDQEGEAKEEGPKKRVLQLLMEAKGHTEGGAAVLFIIHRSTNSNCIVYKGSESTGIEVSAVMRITLHCLYLLLYLHIWSPTDSLTCLLQALWMMFEKGGAVAPTEGLTFTERKVAFGFTARVVSTPAAGCLEWAVDMAALADRTLTVKLYKFDSSIDSAQGGVTSGVWICTTRIDGVEGTILRAGERAVD